MALARKFLKALGLEDNQIEGIIGEHLETVNGLKGERDDLQEQLEVAKQVPKPSKGGQDPKQPDEPGDDSYKAKLAEKEKELADYKARVEAEKAEEQERGLYRQLLEKAGIDSKRIGSVLKVSDLAKVTVKDGEIEGAQGARQPEAARVAVPAAGAGHARDRVLRRRQRHQGHRGVQAGRIMPVRANPTYISRMRGRKPLSHWEKSVPVSDPAEAGRQEPSFFDVLPESVAFMQRMYI